MATTDDAAPEAKRGKRRSKAQQAKKDRAEKILVAYERDKDKLSKDAGPLSVTISETLARIEARDKRRAELELEQSRLTLEQDDDYKKLTKQSADMGRHADTAFGAGTPEASAYRKDS